MGELPGFVKTKEGCSSEDKSEFLCVLIALLGHFRERNLVSANALAACTDNKMIGADIANRRRC